MSIANIPGGWLFSSRMLRLPITARWSYVAALLWCHNEESDGFIRSDDLPVIPGFDMDCIPRLQDQDILVAVEGGWKLQPNGEAWENSQSTKEQVDQARLRNRERQAKLRERRNGVTPPVTTEVTNEVSNEGSKQNKTKPNQTSLVVVTESGTETEKGRSAHPDCRKAGSRPNRQSARCARGSRILTFAASMRSSAITGCPNRDGMPPRLTG